MSTTCPELPTLLLSARDLVSFQLEPSSGYISSEATVRGLIVLTRLSEPFALDSHLQILSMNKVQGVWIQCWLSFLLSPISYSEVIASTWRTSWPKLTLLESTTSE